jgi:hypothetical protein
MQIILVRLYHKGGVRFYPGFATHGSDEIETARVKIDIGLIADGLDNFHCTPDRFT